MNRNIQKCISVFLTLLFCLSLCMPVAAASNATHVIVHTYSDSDEQHRLTPFVIYDDNVYIRAEDALALSGYDTFHEDYGEVVFKYGHHTVKHKDGQLDFAGVFYYPLKNLMDALSTSYHYDETSETLIFITCTSYFENLLADCKSIFDDGYELKFLEGTGWQIAGVYEIVAGLRVDAFWGGYQRELYEDTLSGILVEEDSEFAATLKQGSSIMSKLSTLLKFTKKDINNVDTYMDFLGSDLDGVIEAYDKLNDLVKGISLNDAIDILDYVFSSMDVAETYPNAVKYGLVENPYIEDLNLVYATDRVYSLYDENKSTFEVVVTSLLTDVFQGAADKYGKDKVKEFAQTAILDLVNEFAGADYEKIILNTAYVKLAKLLFDEMGMKERSTAVMQTVAARNIQFVAELQYKLNNGEIGYIIRGNGSFKAQDKPNAMRVKYSTILYLRACQYAYSLYEFDSALAPWCAMWQEKTEKAISVISAYSDDELNSSVNNSVLSVDQLKTHAPETVSDYGFIPNSLKVKDWSSWGPVEYCPSITFYEDMTCDVTFNMAEWMHDFSAKYKLFTNIDGRNAIKVDLSGVTIGDGKTHKTPWFYLFETGDGDWEYYGEGIGFTHFGSLYSAVNEQEILIPSARILPDINDFEGQYQWTQGEIFDILTLREIENGSVTFDASWYRTADIVEAQGDMYGNLVPFHYKYYDEGLDEYFYETTGVLEILGETTVLTIFDTSLPGIDSGTYIYQKQEPISMDTSIFDGTYWWLSFGQTMGTNYAAKFYSDGTFAAVSTGSGSVSNGIYEYYNGTIILNFEDYNNICYNKKGSEFVSIEKYPMQVGSGYYRISPDKNAAYENLYTYESEKQPEDIMSLSDGEYKVEIYKDGTSLIAGAPFETIGVLEYVEISNDEAIHMEVGDVIQLPEMNITISKLDLVEGDGYKEFWINDGEYRCGYIVETDTWRFLWPSDVAMTYYSGTYTVAAPAPTIIDMRTALGIGQNIYGDRYNGETSKDALIFLVLSLSDYFSYHNSETEYATMTITDGIITEIFIPYRP